MKNYTAKEKLNQMGKETVIYMGYNLKNYSKSKIHSLIAAHEQKTRTKLII